MKLANRKYQAIFSTAKNLFWKHGIRRVSVMEICKESGVSKMTYYKYFRNKNELVKYIIDDTVKEYLREYRKFWDSDLPFEKKVEKVIEFKMKFSGDISQEFINDLYSNGDIELQQYMQKLMEENMQAIRRDFTAAREKGEINSEISIDFIMYLMDHVVEMITDGRLTKNCANPQILIRELFEFLFYGIIPRNKKATK